MPKQYRKEISFQAGELSPLFFGRSETEQYDKGLAIAENVNIDKRGGAFRRTGLEHVGQLDGNDSRIFTKQIDRFRFDTIIISENIGGDPTKTTGTIIAPGAGFLTPNLLTNGNFAAEGANWISLIDPVSSVVNFSAGACTLLPEQDDPNLVSNGNFDQAATDWSSTLGGGSAEVNFINSNCDLISAGGGGNFARIFQSVSTPNVGDVHEVVVEGLKGLHNVSLKVGTGEDDGTYLDVLISDLSASEFFTPAASPFTITISALGGVADTTTLTEVRIPDPTVKIAAISQEATVTALTTDVHLVQVEQDGTGQLTIKIGSAAGLGDIDSFVVSNQINPVLFVPNAATFFVTVESNGDSSLGSVLTFVGAVAEASSGGIGLQQVTPWTEAQLPELHIVESPDGEAIYFTHPNVAPHKLAYNFALDSYGTFELVVFVAPPLVWTGNNQPATGTFFQGRLWFGGTPAQPQTFWASVSGTPEDFTITGGQDSSSMEFTLQKFGRIQWMLGTKDLLLGTENGEHIVESDAGVIIPSDFNIQQQSSYGSSHMQAIQVGEKVFYMTPDGRRLRAMSFDFVEDNWLSADLTFASEHITKGVVEHRSWLQNPSALFAMTLEDGTVATLTYDRSSDTLGWTRWIMEGFQVQDIASALQNGVSRMVLTGRRTSGKVDVESDGADDAYLDSYATVFNEAASGVLTGLDHLEGETVQVLVDGAVNPTEVVIGGQITAETAGNRLFAGIQIKSKIVTLPPDVPQDSIRSWKKRWNKVWALLHQSNAPIINGIRPPDRTPMTPMDTPEPVQSGHFKTVNLGWDDFGQITIEEDLPVAMNVLAIYGEMGAETL